MIGGLDRLGGALGRGDIAQALNEAKTLEGGRSRAQHSIVYRRASDSVVDCSQQVPE
jgi:hypothetical protein